MGYPENLPEFAPYLRAKRPVREQRILSAMSRVNRYRVGAFYTALVLLGFGALAGAHGGHHLVAGTTPSSTCRLDGAKVFLETREVLVSSVAPSGSDPRFARNARFYACYKATGAKRRLDRGLKTQFRVYRPSGRFVVSVAYDTIAGRVAADLTDVRSGMRNKLLRAPWESGNGDVAVVLLKRNGSVAFLTVTEPDILYRCEMASCYAPSRRARLTRLDRGAIPEASVRLQGDSTVVWRNGDRRRSAPLR